LGQAAKKTDDVEFSPRAIFLPHPGRFEKVVTAFQAYWQSALRRCLAGA
jgi:hypothetical protein